MALGASCDPPEFNVKAFTAFLALPPKILLRSTKREKQSIPPRTGTKITVSRRPEIVSCDE